MLKSATFLCVSRLLIVKRIWPARPPPGVESVPGARYKQSSTLANDAPNASSGISAVIAHAGVVFVVVAQR